ncbi:MAG: ClbS/DfsB family four-helix bundle protein [Campylobacteraceae bacterium]|nr:ClbS/DfsB family four-helix bundle protein [Campylobacteraceae bacterium]
MPRPKNKKELIDLSKERKKVLFDLINSFANKEISFKLDNRDKNLRDVLAHLHQWHLMFLLWYKDGMNNKKPIMPEEGYTWKRTKELNQNIWQKYQNKSFVEVELMFNDSYKKIQELIEKHSYDELYTKKYYKWTNTTSLASYLISASSSHYDWAIKLIKKEKKAL